MKLVGTIKNVDRMIAKHVGDVLEEKRGYKFQIRPATRPDSYYGYGTMHFIVHGQEMIELGVDLGDEVEILVVKKGENYDGKDYEAARSDLYAAQQELETALTQLRQSQDRVKKHEQAMDEMRTRGQALQVENVRQLTEITTLKTMLQTGDLPGLIEATRPSQSS